MRLHSLAKEPASDDALAFAAQAAAVGRDAAFSFFLWASPIPRIALGLAKAFERIDRITAQWKAEICLLALAAVFGIALWAG
jgi:hypothetical protein